MFFLSDEEFENYKQITQFKQLRWLVGRYAAKIAIQDYFSENFNKKIHLKSIKILKNGLKKPFCNIEGERMKIDFSLSHKDNMVVTAVSHEGLIGIDLERIRNFTSHELKDFLNDKEREFVKNDPLLATLLWSLKESYLKAIGLGITKHPKKIEIKKNKV